jgi:hypothetical protein
MRLLFAALREAVEWLKGKAPQAQQTGKTRVDGKSAWWGMSLQSYGSI